MLDATLSRPPSPSDFTRPRLHADGHVPPRFTGQLVIPSTQADILGAWLMAPGRPSLGTEKESIKPDREPRRDCYLWR